MPSPPARNLLAAFLARNKIRAMEFAYSIGATESAVYAWKTGKRIPGRRFSLAIAKVTAKKQGQRIPPEYWDTLVEKAAAK